MLNRALRSETIRTLTSSDLRHAVGTEHGAPSARWVVEQEPVEPDVGDDAGECVVLDEQDLDAI